jgi:hypothetical protein
MKNLLYDNKIGWLMSHNSPYLSYGSISNLAFCCRGQSVLFYLTKPGTIAINSDKLEIISKMYQLN